MYTKVKNARHIRTNVFKCKYNNNMWNVKINIENNVEKNNIKYAIMSILYGVIFMEFEKSTLIELKKKFDSITNTEEKENKKIADSNRLPKEQNA